MKFKISVGMYTTTFSFFLSYNSVESHKKKKKKKKKSEILFNYANKL